MSRRRLRKTYHFPRNYLRNNHHGYAINYRSNLRLIPEIPILHHTPYHQTQKQTHPSMDLTYLGTYRIIILLDLNKKLGQRRFHKFKRFNMLCFILRQVFNYRHK